jgi:DNA-binding LacI/PurR family transcriptional regulator
MTKKTMQRDGNVYSALEDDLRRNILMGTIDYGKPILGEIELAGKYGISRESARKAISNLVTEGLLERLKGKGTYIIPPERRAQSSTSGPGGFSILVIEPFINKSFSEYRDNFLESVTSHCNKNKIQIKCSDADIDRQAIINAHKNNELTGIIWDMPYERDRETARVIVQSGIPIVTCGHHIAGAPCVCSDFQAEITESVSLLRDLGHRDIALLNANLDEMPYIEREKAYFNMISSGKFYLKVDHNADFNGELTRMLKEKPSALIVGGHGLIKKSMETIRSLKLRLREDISVICVNDCLTARENSPPLTVFAENRAKAGVRCAEILLETAHGSATQSGIFKIKGDLIWRQSCGPA